MFQLLEICLSRYTANRANGRCRWRWAGLLNGVVFMVLKIFRGDSETLLSHVCWIFVSRSRDSVDIFQSTVICPDAENADANRWEPLNLCCCSRPPVAGNLTSWNIIRSHRSTEHRGGLQCSQSPRLDGLGRRGPRKHPWEEEDVTDGAQRQDELRSCCHNYDEWQSAVFTRANVCFTSGFAAPSIYHLGYWSIFGSAPWLKH